MRMLLRGLVVVAVALMCASSAQALFEMDLTVDPGNTLGGALSDFPVLVKLTPARTNGYAGLGGDGSTLRFYQGATMLAHEIEDWNVGGESNVWVKVPTISTGGATTITAKWDAVMPAALPTTDVWSNGFLGGMALPSVGRAYWGRHPTSGRLNCEHFWPCPRVSAFR